MNKNSNLDTEIEYYQYKQTLYIDFESGKLSTSSHLNHL